ncbi:retinol dehydrogenase [Lophium mytilinum]|uniref:Retinol dehydrogenase n=1 Tax=Lophium mytilinum TaxID=390894 RepID=A0A6A6QLD0_9PEZI|nr:retinol dehydrogenase [Lophium mytilinum]
MFGFGATAFKAEDIPDLSGKVILVTGGNSGLGAESILQLAKHNPSKIYLAARTEAKANTAIAAIKEKVPNATITFLELDLGSLASVKKAADAVTQSTGRLDILLNNAGIMATPAGLTKDGYEIQFGTNHMGHALLTRLLLPTLQKTAKEQGANADVRIVNLSSKGHGWAPKGGLVLDQCKTDMASTATFVRYGQSKLANILYTKALAARYPAIRCVSVHPGAVDTGLVRGPGQSWPILVWPMWFVIQFSAVNVAHGALTQLFAATSKDAKTGAYYVPTAQENAGSAYAQDEKLVDVLWDYTEKELNAAGY